MRMVILILIGILGFQAIGLGFAPNEPISSANVTINGTLQGTLYPYDHGEFWISNLGDVNGDDLNDIIMGSMETNTGGALAGAAYLFFGRIEWPSQLSLNDADVIFYGHIPNGLAGFSVADAGDFDGDGYQDILIGAPGRWDTGSDKGRAYLIYGRPTWNEIYYLNQADFIITGDSSRDRAGLTLDGVGDFNGDGVDDIAIGIELDDYGAQNAGTIAIFLGSTIRKTGIVAFTSAELVYYSPYADSRLGWQICGAGDVNGDGFNDIIVGARYFASFRGRVFIILGGNTKPTGSVYSIEEAEIQIRSPYTNCHLGQTIGVGGDINNDGYDDIILYIPPLNKNIVILGRQNWEASMSVDDADISIYYYNNQACKLMGTPGDFNNDGYLDIPLGNPFLDIDDQRNYGKLYLLFNNQNSWQSEYLIDENSYSFVGVHANNAVGKCIASGLDINGDSIDDLIIGNKMDSGQPNAWRVSIVFGYKWTPPQPPSSSPPTILGGGYWKTRLTELHGGEFTMLAWVNDLDGREDIDEVRVYVQDFPTSLFLNDDGINGDAIADDGLYTFKTSIPALMPEGQYLLEVKARDKHGRYSQPWPYLNIGESADYYSYQAAMLETINGKSVIGPYICIAGYLDNDIKPAVGGSVRIFAYVEPFFGNSTEQMAVQLYYGFIPTGIYLFDDGEHGDFEPNDRIFANMLNVDAPVPPGRYLLNIVATDSFGFTSDMWPYVQIH